MRDIISGIILIGIGLMFGGSIFLGDFSLLNLLFDGLGSFFIIRGVIAIRKEKQQAQAPAAPQRPVSRPGAPAAPQRPVTRPGAPAAPPAPPQRPGTR